MRFLTSLSIGLAFGLLSACDAGSETKAQEAAPSKPQSQAVSEKQPVSQSQTQVRRRLIPISETQSPTQGQPFQRGNISEAQKPKVFPNWSVRPDESSIVFKGRQTGDEFTGRFETFTADIVFYEAALKGSSVEVVIDMSSFDAGSKDRNEALPGKEWFSVDEFPNAFFVSSGFSKLGDKLYETKGELTIRGITLPVTLPFNLDITQDGMAKMSGSLEIDRSQFGVGQGAWAKGEWVDLNVGIDITLVADKRF